MSHVSDPRVLLPRKREVAVSTLNGCVAVERSLMVECLTRVGSAVFDIVHKPNKAPEPTSTSVMPRAIVSFLDLKQRTAFPIHARVIPAVAVAHL